MAYSVQGESSSSFSTSNSTPKWNYDVFLSFAGKDTRLNFIDHLYSALKRHGINAFRDNEALERGEVISQQLLQAIEDSLCAVVVLSENYASSTWCLDELQKILESKNKLGRKVIPIFYGIDPSDVRHQRKSFEEALVKHEERFRENRENKNKVQKWRDALSQVSNLSGWNSKGWHEADLIENVVEGIWTYLCSKIPSYYDNLVGISSKMADMLSLIDIGLDDIRFVGIWGMGGIGKTTLARLVYEKIYCQFEMCCFLINVREASERSDIVDLQRELLSHLNKNNKVIKNKYEGKEIIKNLFYNKRVLLVLDDVNHQSQFENLAESPKWFGAGSRVIITTRDLHLLKSNGVHRIYDIKILKEDESLQLFSKKTFSKDHPQKDYLVLSKSVVEYAGGLPLALQVLGSVLCGRSIPEWEDALDKLKQIPDDGIMQKLKISYDTLDEEEKKIFLDIACFFKGWHKDIVTRILKNCGFHVRIGIPVLIERALLAEKKTRYGPVLVMHDLLQEFGRNIIFQESPNNVGKRSRLWNSEEIKELLKNNTGSEAIQAIVLFSDGEVEVHPKAFSKMRNLRLFYSTCRLKHCSGFKYSSHALKVIAWVDDLLKPFPLDIHFMKNLKHVNLRGCQSLMKTPDFSGVPNLETLNLEECDSLVEVHSSVGQLKKLVMLNLNCCCSLEILPSKLEMNSLMVLILSYCFKLSVLPEFGECMKRLSLLNISYTKAITELPQSLGFLTGLKILSLQGCRKLPFHKLLKNPTTPHFSVFNLTSLTVLSLDSCGITDGTIPNDFGCLSSLLELYLAFNHFINLPADCFSSLSQLQYLHLSNCERLKSLPKLPPKLVRLDADHCPSMEPLSDTQLWNLVSSLDHEHRHRMKVEITELNHIESEYLPQRDFFAIIWGNEIPSWFQNKEYFHSYDDAEAKEDVMIKVDIPQHFRTSEWSGIAVCLNIGCEGGSEYACIWWSSKAPEDDHYVFKEWAHRCGIKDPHHCIMVLHLNEKTCWQHQRGGNNCLHVKLGLRSKYYQRSGSKIHIWGCGWRMICKEEMEEWCNNNTNDLNKLTKAEEVASSFEVQVSPSQYIVDQTIEILGSSPNQSKAMHRNEENWDWKNLFEILSKTRRCFEFFAEDGSISHKGY